MCYTTREIEAAYEEYFEKGGTIKMIPRGQVTDPDVLSAMLRPKRGRKKKMGPYKKVVDKKS